MKGATVRPRYWQDLLRVAIPLHLSKNELDSLLLAANHSTWEELYVLTSTQKKDPEQEKSLVLLAHWEEDLITFTQGQTLVTKRREEWRMAPNMAPLYGRTDELADLTKYLIQDKCQIVTILGMGGIGKTSLAAKAARTVAEQFDSIIWLSLANAPPFTDLIKDLLQFLSDYIEQEIPKNIHEQINLTLTYLQQKRCLIIFDNYETLLQSKINVSKYLPGYDNYGYFLEQLGKVKHKGCFLVTSREKPTEIALLESLPSVEVLNLPGLNVKEAEPLLPKLIWHN